MRRLLFMALVFSASANARDVKCPDYYPSKEIALSEVPLGHKGSGVLRGGKLSNAMIYVGELHQYPYGGFDAMQSVGKKVKDGEDTEYRFTSRDTKWLVCVYGGNSFNDGGITGNTEWWEELDSKTTSCVLKVRETKKRHMPKMWTATASCR